MAKNYVITWDSVPDFDDYGFDDWWDCLEWEAWHGELKTHFGKSVADHIWIYAWDKQTTGSGALDCRSFNSDFKKFLRKENLADDAGNFISDMIGGGYDIVKAVGKGAVASAKVVSVGIPVLVAGLVAGGLYLIYRKAKTL